MRMTDSPAFARTRAAARALCASALACAMLVWGASGCASNQPLKSDKLELAIEVLSHANAMGAGTYAPADMQTAHERITQAQTALNAGDLARTDALSEEALASARLAEIRAQAAKAQAAAAELQQGSRDLQRELQNNLK